MTQFEKDEALRVLQENQLVQRATMAESDAHADQCIKLGANFEETYPEEYAAYVAARAKFHENEAEIERIEAIIPEDEPHPEIDAATEA